MTNFAAAGPAPALVPVIQEVLSAHGGDDVRDAVAHGVRVISPFDALSLYEADPVSGALDLTMRSGTELGMTAEAVEQLLCEKAAKTGRTASTLDRLVPRDDEAVAAEYARRYGLCLARPLEAYGALVGVIVLHYGRRTALVDEEFDALRRFVSCAAVALANARTREELHGYAYTDPLTGLANRRRLELEFARLEAGRLSLLVIDFDGLKAVNDTLGYDSGDALIRAIGIALSASAGPDEFVVRLGGDEFVVILPGAERHAAAARAEALTQILDRLALPPEIAPLFRGASVGWAVADHGERADEVLGRATAEMRSRKRRRKSDRELAAAESAAAGLGLAAES